MDLHSAPLCKSTMMSGYIYVLAHPSDPDLY